MKNKAYKVLLSFLMALLFINIQISQKNINKNLAYSDVITNITSCDNVKILPDQTGGFFIVSPSGTSCSISYFDYLNNKIYSYDPSTKDPDIPDPLYSGALVSNSTLYIIEKKDSKINLYPYNVTNSNIELSYIYSINCNFTLLNQEKIQDKVAIFASSGNPIVYSIGSDRKSIARSTVQGSFFTISNNETINYLMANPSGTKLYAITSSDRFLCFDNISSSTTREINIPTVSSPYTFLDDDTILATDGNVYNISSGSGVKIGQISSNAANCLFDNYILYKDSDSLIKCINKSTQGITHKISIDGTVKLLSSFKVNNEYKAIALIQKDTQVFIKIIQLSDLTEIPTQDPGGNEDPGTPTEPNIPDADKVITSSIYEIDYDKKFIIGLTEGVTIAEFKKNISYEGYNLKFKNYVGTEVTSGKIGTGASVLILSGEDLIYEFKTVLIGDLTGEGNINSRDITALYNHLFEAKKLENEYFLAADINKDGEVNTLDLLLLKQMIAS